MRKKNLWLCAAMAALFALAAVTFGGCGGGGDKDTVVGYIGTIQPDDAEYMTQAGITLTEFDNAKAEDYDSVVIADMASLSDESKQAIVRLYNDDDGSANNIVLLDPKSGDIESLAAILSEDFTITSEYNSADLAASPDAKLDDLTVVSAYGVKKERDGDVCALLRVRHKLGYPFNVVQDSAIVSGDENRVSATLSGDMFEVYRADLEHEHLGQTSPDNVVIGENSMSLTLSGDTYDCVGVRSGDKGYSIFSGDVIECDIPTTEAAKKAAGWMTDAEKVAANDKLDAEELRGWLLSQGEDHTQKTTTDEKVNILNYAKNYCGSANATWDEIPGVSLTVNSYIVSVHHFKTPTDTKGGDDVYLITQKCILNGKSSEYHHTRENGYFTSRVRDRVMHWRNYTYPVNGGDVDEFFMWKYFVRSEIPKVKDLKLEDIKPTAVNRETKHSFKHGWEVGVEIKAATEKNSNGEEKDSKSVGLNYGYNSATEESYVTTDIETKLEQLDRIYKFQWVYSATRVPEKSNPTWTLTRPAELATSTYTPVHTWVWWMPTSERGAYDKYVLDAIPDVGAVYTRNSGSLNPDTLAVSPRRGSNILYKYTNIKLPKPPLFALDKDDAIIDKKGNDVQVLIFSQGDWEWKTEDVPSWLKVVKTGEPSSVSRTLLLSAEENKTGDIRQAKITVYRKNCNDKFDKAVITVTQSRN